MIGDVAVAIVGGGPAGLTAAAALLRSRPALAGQVVVLERATYPRDKPCAGAIGGRGLAILRRLGIEPSVPHVPIEGIALRTRFADRTTRVGVLGRVVRRLEFDDALAGLARARGVRIVEGARVEGVTVGTDGATLATAAGPLRARVVIGADGVGSVVRRAVGAGPGRLRAQAVEVDTEPVAGDPPRGVLRFDMRDRGLAGYSWDFPTPVDGRLMVSRGIYQLRTFAADGADVGALLDAHLRALGLDPGRYVARRYAERGLCFDSSLARGPLLLCGEAAGIDPIAGEGIAQAIEYGALAGRFVARVLAGRATVEDWTRVVRRSRLGLDLATRAVLASLVYGKSRALTERALFLPGVLTFCARQFGAVWPTRWPSLAGLGPWLEGVREAALSRG